ncbi:MAG: hypothetical protein NZ849_00700 [Meiothermus sp.]|uniref:hypothetical protein n=1 Tax=Meiothermus sp. TaxID=1955249 RepID=UPI0025CDEB55|nr:hypothetical protein [Meiothermus sp.]MCS7193429.1 hypothetical protein [Meiothermus sp.]
MRGFLFLLLPLLLAASCSRQPAAPPPPLPVDPPADGPIVWGNAEDPRDVFFYFKDNARGLEVTTYIEALDGSWRHQWYGTPDIGEVSKQYREMQSFGANEGYILHYGLDVSPDRRYGGRKFFWRYRFRIDAERGFPWRFEAPVGPVVFGVIDRFPWEDRPGLAGKTPRSPEVWSALNLGPISGPLIACFQQTAPYPLELWYKRGIYISFWKSAPQQGRNVGQLHLPPSFTLVWSWTNGVSEGLGEARDVDAHHSIGVDSPEIILNNRTDNWVLYYAAAQGRGPFLHPWERKLWRLMGRRFGAVEQPDGSVRCERGEWRVEEVTSPREVVDFFINDMLQRPENGNRDLHHFPEGTPIEPGSPFLPPGWP